MGSGGAGTAALAEGSVEALGFGFGRCRSGACALAGPPKSQARTKAAKTVT